MTEIFAEKGAGVSDLVGAGDALKIPRAPILVLGLGNPLLGDDGVGWCVAEECSRKLAPFNTNSSQVEIDCHAGGGLSLMERLVGYDRVILIDSLTTSKHPMGTVQACQLEEMTNPAAGHLASSHDTSLQNALAAGLAMRVKLPGQVMVVTVEAERVYEFAREFSPPVARAVPLAAQLVLEILSVWKKSQGVHKRTSTCTIFISCVTRPFGQQP